MPLKPLMQLRGAGLRVGIVTARFNAPICEKLLAGAKKALAEMESGEILRVQATDPGSLKDFPAFAKQTGNELVEQKEENRVFEFFLKRK